MTGTCPRCGGPGLHPGDATRPDTMKRWGFRLRPECPYCGLRYQEESGVTLGTTVVGYVLVLLLVVAPILIGTALGWLSLWWGVVLGVLLSFGIPALLYPLLLRVTLAAWFGFHPDAFDQENEPPRSPHS